MSSREEFSGELQRCGAQMTSVFGLETPADFGDWRAEFASAAEQAAVFDLTDFSVLQAQGPEAGDFLRRLLAGDVATLASSHAMATCMMNPMGCVQDCSAVASVDGQYRLWASAAAADQDLAWMMQVSKAFDVQVSRRGDAVLGVAGPAAQDCVAALAAIPQLRPLEVRTASWQGVDLLVSRLGLLAPDGWEITLPEAAAAPLWRALVQAGARPGGWRAREALRIEAGRLLVGADVDDYTSPLESGLAGAIDLADTSREFFGRAMATALRDRGVRALQAGLRLLDPGELESGQTVHSAHGEGILTSAAYVPRLGGWAALARLPAAVRPGDVVFADVRGGRQRCLVCRLPFSRD